MARFFADNVFFDWCSFSHNHVQERRSSLVFGRTYVTHLRSNVTPNINRCHCHPRALLRQQLVQLIILLVLSVLVCLRICSMSIRHFNLTKKIWSLTRFTDISAVAYVLGHHVYSTVYVWRDLSLHAHRLSSCDVDAGARTERAKFWADTQRRADEDKRRRMETLNTGWTINNMKNRKN